MINSLPYIIMFLTAKEKKNIQYQNTIPSSFLHVISLFHTHEINYSAYIITWQSRTIF